MIYENNANAVYALSLLLLRAKHLQISFIRGSALIEWAERKVMTFRERLSVTWNKVVKTASRGSIDLPGVSSPTVSFRLRVWTDNVGMSFRDQSQKWERTRNIVIFQGKKNLRISRKKKKNYSRIACS